ncbi:MAG TPA: cyclase family protein [Candidatus Polarisedimenticolaceae bacterium]|nr:cyclase family protein [Candidatus Polarisedimenticolaceae bacterium]
MTRRPLLLLPLLLLAGMLRAADSPEGPPVEPGSFRSPDLVELTALDPTIHLDVRYATANNIFERPVYTQARAFLQRPAAEALVRVHQALQKEGFGLLVFDGYRPWAVTKTFWDLTPAGKKVFVADPRKGSRHNRGCAVDLSLYALDTGKEVEMPSAYDEMSKRAYPTYGGHSQEARARRDLLREAMEREGFFVYPYEWWHFDYKDWRAYPILDIPFERIGGAAGKSAQAPAQVDLGAARLVDLTHAFDGHTLYWPTSTLTFQLQQVSQGPTPGGWFYAANNFCAPEHGGTHLDAPFHFAQGAPTTEQIPLRRLLAPAVVLDVSAQAARDADYRLTGEDVRRWEGVHGRIPEGAIVLLRTGWGMRWPDRKAYFGDDTPGDASRLHFPSYGKEAAELLVRERKVGVLGVDTPSIDHGPSQDFIVHRIAAAADVPGFENLAALEQVPETGAWVLALPMKIAGGSGAPLRVVALLP